MTTASSRSGAWSMPELSALADSSFETIVSLQDDSGAYPASPTFSAYRGYSWFRDGAFIADGVSAYGSERGISSASSFHDWCAGILLSRQGQISEITAGAAAGRPVPDAAMLPTRFTLDGREGDDEWWDFQLDGYGTWLWALAEHAARHSLDLGRWQRSIELAVDYLLGSWNRPCFDWWEERAEEVHVSTLGCIAGGLSAVIDTLDPQRALDVRVANHDIRARIRNDGLVDGHLAKWLGSTEVDASLLAVIHPLDVFPAGSSIGAATIAAIDEQLNVDGGVHRYLGDTFYGGGQWPLLSCMLGLALNAAGQRERALGQLRWAASTVTAEGLMPEQVDRHLLAPERKAEWVDRWGGVATPLLWSHAMYVRLAVELGVGAAA